MKVVYVCRTEDGEFVAFDVGDDCPICGEAIDHVEAPYRSPDRLHPHGKSGTPAAACPNGHLLETERGHHA